jgi:hypothetical protein
LTFCSCPESSLTVFGSAGEKALQEHAKIFAILHQRVNRAILTRVNNGQNKKKLLKKEEAE